MIFVYCNFRAGFSCLVIILSLAILSNTEEAVVTLSFTLEVKLYWVCCNLPNILFSAS